MLTARAWHPRENTSLPVRPASHGSISRISGNFAVLLPFADRTLSQSFTSAPLTWLINAPPPEIPPRRPLLYLPYPAFFARAALPATSLSPYTDAADADTTFSSLAHAPVHRRLHAHLSSPHPGPPGPVAPISLPSYSGKRRDIIALHPSRADMIYDIRPISLSPLLSGTPRSRSAFLSRLLRIHKFELLCTSATY